VLHQAVILIRLDGNVSLQAKCEMAEKDYKASCIAKYFINS